MSDDEPEVGGLAYFEWSVAEAPDLGDERLWEQANPALDVRLSRVFIRGVERDSMDDEEFARERLGVFSDEDDEPQWLVVPREAWASTAAAPLELLDPVTLALECPADLSSAAIAAAGSSGDGAAVELAEWLPSTDTLVARLVEIHETHGTRGVVIDPRSPANLFSEAIAAAGVPVIEAKTHDVIQAALGIYVGITGGTVLHPLGGPHAEKLERAVAVAEQRKVGESWLIDRHADPDVGPFIAASLALWGHRLPVGGNTGVSAYEDNDLMTV